MVKNKNYKTMKSIFRARFSTIKTLFNRIPSFSQTGKHALSFLNVSQFLGVINDNLFKFVMAFLLIDALGKDQANRILSATGAIYVIPFLLFSSSAGILADRFSKQKLLVVMKMAEIGVMILAIFAFSIKSVWGCYSLLFLLSTHSAMFGPSKYGIIPELVPPEKVSRANGLITSFTYLAIIIGTFLAAFLTEFTDRHFTWIAVFCLLLAVIGFLSSISIKRTDAQGSKKRINPFFVREIYQTLKTSRKTPHLLAAICGSSYFLFIGAFTQLNIIPFALQSLGLSEVAGGYLFLVTALGIALGSFIGGKASRKRVELGLSVFAGFGLALFFLLLYPFAHNLILVIIDLIFLGILGGIFVVPFDTFIQVYSDHEKRGQTIAAANFLSFTGVLIASIALYVFNQLLEFSSSSSFAIMGVITILTTTVLMLRLSDLFLPYLSRKIFHPLFRFKRPSTLLIERTSHPLLILEKATWSDALLLMGAFPNLHILIPSTSKKCYPWLQRPFYSFHIVPDDAYLDHVLATARNLHEKEMLPCVFLDDTFPLKDLPKKHPLVELFQRKKVNLLFARVERSPPTGQLSVNFSDTPHSYENE